MWILTEIRKIVLSKNSEKTLIIWKMSVILATFLLFFSGANHFVRIDIKLKKLQFYSHQSRFSYKRAVSDSTVE